MALVVVFDTNVLFSAIGLNGRPAACLERARPGVVEGVTGHVMLDELAEKLHDKLAFSEEHVTEMLADLLGYLHVVEITEPLAVIADDPDDDRVLECAVAAGASHIVTGDRRHLLPLGVFQGIIIMSPADFLAIVPEP